MQIIEVRGWIHSYIDAIREVLVHFVASCNWLNVVVTIDNLWLSDILPGDFWDLDDVRLSKDAIGMFTRLPWFSFPSSANFLFWGDKHASRLHHQHCKLLSSWSLSVFLTTWLTIFHFDKSSHGFHGLPSGIRFSCHTGGERTTRQGQHLMFWGGLSTRSRQCFL